LRERRDLLQDAEEPDDLGGHLLAAYMSELASERAVCAP
jgi:hypothetical protein